MSPILSIKRPGSLGSGIPPTEITEAQASMIKDLLKFHPDLTYEEWLKAMPIKGRVVGYVADDEPGADDDDFPGFTMKEV